jgi:hypothetical protein
MPDNIQSEDNNTQTPAPRKRPKHLRPDLASALRRARIAPERWLMHRGCRAWVPFTRNGVGVSVFYQKRASSVTVCAVPATINLLNFPDIADAVLSVGRIVPVQTEIERGLIRVSMRVALLPEALRQASDCCVDIAADLACLVAAMIEHPELRGNLKAAQAWFNRFVCEQGRGLVIELRSMPVN